jgi:GNAT superfamily N-acetyltransferase
VTDHHHRMPPQVRPAVPGDIDEILALVTELAAFERLSDSVQATAGDLAAALFSPAPRVFCDIAEGPGGKIMGFSMFFYTFSTFRGRHGLWIEDLFVRPAFRRHGIGTALMAEAAKRCVAENLARLEWSVLDWNEEAIAFYTRQGATMMSDWTSCRIDAEALWRMADKARG